MNSDQFRKSPADGERKDKPEWGVRYYFALDRKGSTSDVDQAKRYFDLHGAKVVGESSRHLLVRGKRQIMEAILHQDVGYHSSELVEKAGYSLPKELAQVVRTVVEDRPTRNCGPLVDPPADYTQSFIEDNYLTQSDFDPGNFDAPSLMFFSDIRQELGVETLNEQGILGEGVTVFVIDSGVHFDTKFFSQNPDFQTQVSALATTAEYDHASDILRDMNGHGTMVTCGVLSMAPKAEVVMVTSPPFNRDNDGKWLFGRPSTTEFLSGVERIISKCEQMDSVGPCLVSLSVGATPSTFGDDMAKYLGFSFVLNDLLASLFKMGVVVFAAVGNLSYTDAGLVPGQSPWVLGVGGAFPTKLQAPHGQEWSVSRQSLSGHNPLLYYPAEEVSGSISEELLRFPAFCSIEGQAGTKQGSHSALFSTPGVDIVFPVAIGWSDDFMHQIRDEFFEGGLGDIALGIFFLNQTMDRILAVYKPDGPTDGWALGIGGTSLATAFAAGTFACVASAFGPELTPFSEEGLDNYDEVLGGIAKLKQILGQACVDVNLGKNGSNIPADIGPDDASGFGVLHAGYLLELFTELLD